MTKGNWVIRMVIKSRSEQRTKRATQGSPFSATFTRWRLKSDNVGLNSQVHHGFMIWQRYGHQSLKECRGLTSWRPSVPIDFPPQNCCHFSACFVFVLVVVVAAVDTYLLTSAIYSSETEWFWLLEFVSATPVVRNVLQQRLLCQCLKPSYIRILTTLQTITLIIIISNLNRTWRFFWFCPSALLQSTFLLKVHFFSAIWKQITISV